jgi:hypothetical protein
MNAPLSVKFGLDGTASEIVDANGEFVAACVDAETAARIVSEVNSAAALKRLAAAYRGHLGAWKNTRAWHDERKRLCGE